MRFHQDVTALPKIGISSKTGFSKKNGIPSVINDFVLGLRVTPKGSTIVGGDQSRASNGRRKEGCREALLSTWF